MLTCICPVLSVSFLVQSRRSNLARGTQIMSQSPSQGLFGYPMGKTQVLMAYTLHTVNPLKINLKVAIRIYKNFE